MNFVRGVSIPNDELAILRSRDKVTLVVGPVHGVDLGKMTFECSSWLHDDSWQWLNVVGHGAKAGICHLILLGTDLFFDTVGLATCGGDALLQVSSWY